MNTMAGTAPVRERGEGVAIVKAINKRSGHYS